MRILILAQVFPPELHPTAIMIADLARRLSGAGHEVTVAAGYPHHPGGRLIGGSRRRPLSREEVDGYRVVRGWHFLTTSSRMALRTLAMLSQTVGIAFAAITCRRPDVVVNFGPPLLGPLVSRIVAPGAVNVSVIYDIYPDIAVETGKLRNPLLVRWARVLERAAYRVSDRIVVLSEGFRETLRAKGVPGQKLSVIPVWLDPDEIRPMDHDSPWRRQQGISPETKVILYAGTVGLVSGAEIVLDVAEKMRGRTDVLFLFVGDGRLKTALEETAGRRSLPSVRFLPFQPRERLPEVQAASVVSLVTLAPGRGRTSVPSKVVAYLAAGRPVVASVDANSDTARMVRAAACGTVTDPGDAESLSEAIELLLSDDGRRSAMGASGRAYFDANFSRDAVLAKFVGLLAGEERAHRGNG